MGKTYDRVIDGVIVEYNKTLPFSNKETSFGTGASDEEMAEFGYLPVIGDAPVLEENQRQAGMEHQIRDGCVEKVYTVVTLTDDEVVAEKTPSQITQRQCRLQLVKDGNYQAVVDAIGTMGAEAQIEWEYANDIQRDNPLVGAIQGLLGKSDREMNEFFINASQL